MGWLFVRFNYAAEILPSLILYPVLLLRFKKSGGINFAQFTLAGSQSSYKTDRAFLLSDRPVAEQLSFGLQMPVWFYINLKAYLLRVERRLAVQIKSASCRPARHEGWTASILISQRGHCDARVARKVSRMRLRRACHRAGQRLI